MTDPPRPDPPMDRFEPEPYFLDDKRDSDDGDERLDRARDAEAERESER